MKRLATIDGRNVYRKGARGFTLEKEGVGWTGKRIVRGLILLRDPEPLPKLRRVQMVNATKELGLPLCWLPL